MSEELTFIDISERAYKYIRQFTIKTVDDALVELITNSIDAYNKTNSTERLIEISVVENSVIVCRDRAIGLTAEEMVECFLQVGNYTSTDGSRGFFSRGAKDISALGDVYFKAIKDNKYSECLINTDAYGTILSNNVDVTDEIRNQIGIPDPYNGMSVELHLLPNFQNPNIDTLYHSLCRLGVLRDIVTNNNNQIYLTKTNLNGDILFNKRVNYIYPNSSMILDLEYIIPNYTNHKAKFVVYKTNTPLPQPAKESEMEFGFLVKDSTSVYEVNTLSDRFRWNPYINYIYGYVYSDAIKTFLVDYDTNGPSETNPYPIIDPSRLTGVNKLHPLIINILSIPLVRLDLILRELNNSISSKSVTIDDIDDLLNELDQVGLDIIEQEEIEINFVPNYDAQLVKAINDERANYVTYEKSYLLSNSFDTEELQLENYIKEEIIRIQDATASDDLTFFLDSNLNLTQIQSTDSGLDNDPIDIIDLIPEENIQDLQNNPYIYKLGPDGELLKLYVFQKGIIENVDDTLEKDLIAKSKQFRIEFINDINIPQRYIIDSTDGIRIKINLHNPIIAKYMTTQDISSIDQVSDFINIGNLRSTQTLTFFKDLVTDILADIVVENDVKLGKIILDGSSVINVRKINEHRNFIITRIEEPIDKIFSKYINSKVTAKIDTIKTDIQNLENAIEANIIISDDIRSGLQLLKSQLLNSVYDLVE